MLAYTRKLLILLDFLEKNEFLWIFELSAEEHSIT